MGLSFCYTITYLCIRLAYPFVDIGQDPKEVIQDSK